MQRRLMLVCVFQLVEKSLSLRDIAPSRQAITFSPDGSGNLVNSKANSGASDLPDSSYARNRMCDNGENPDDSDFTDAGEAPPCRSTLA